MTLFFRLLDVDAEERPSVLKEAVRFLESRAFSVHPTSFRRIPGSPLVYWLPPQLLRLFERRESWDRYATRCGLGTLDDFRFLRTWWEVTRGRGSTWTPFAKGGAFFPWLADLVLVIDWGGDGHELKVSVEQKVGSASRKVQGEDHYFRAGVTWPRLPHVLGSFQLLPPGCIYSDGGPALFADDPELLLSAVSILNSAPYLYLLDALMPRGSEGGQTLKYETGYVSSVPLPPLEPETRTKLWTIARESFALMWEVASADETTRSHVVPALFRHAWRPDWATSIDARLSEIGKCNDELAFSSYGLADGDVRTVRAWAREKRQRLWSSLAERFGNHRALWGDLLSWCMGTAFGRFDVRLATGAQELPPAPEPLSPLPQCSPGMLTGADGLPLDAPPPGYPINFPHDGILVDDQGHERDLVARARQVFHVVYGDGADARQREAAEILDSPGRDLRAWFAGTFFDDHIKRYSKSRRKAPIYWQLATPSASFSVWLYYHRFTRDTLYRVLNDYVTPKLKHEERKVINLTQDAGPNPSASQRKEIDAQERFVIELRAFREEVARVAPLWNPDLDDGVIINFAPLWRLVPQNRSWQKECKAVWDKLVACDYDWAHVAMHLWPERVVPKCARDRSLAIAHGLEDLLWVEDVGGWRALMPPAKEAESLVRQRTSRGITQLREALAQVCDRHGGLSASELWRLLANGALDDEPIALLLWPKRVVVACLYNAALAMAHGISQPTRLTRQAVERLVRKHTLRECLAARSSLESTFRLADEPAGAMWLALAAGDRDAESAALVLWPERVVTKCVHDRDLAEGHGLHRFFWYEDPMEGWRRRRDPSDEVEIECRRRHNEAVKAALDDLLRAPASALTSGGGRRSGGHRSAAIASTARRRGKA